jgi:hypothetical protein
VAVSAVALALVVGLRDSHDRDGGAPPDADRKQRVVETRPSNDQPPLSSDPVRPMEGEVSSKATVKPSTVARFRAQRREVERSRLEPEVLVPPEEAELLIRFALELQERQVAPGSLVASNGPSLPIPEAQALDIAPLDIASLDAPDVSGT